MKKLLFVFAILLCMLMFPPLVYGANEVIPEEATNEGVNVLSGAYDAIIKFFVSEEFTKIWSSLTVLYLAISPMIRKHLNAKQLAKLEALRLKFDKIKTEASNWKSLAVAYNDKNIILDQKLDAVLSTIGDMTNASNIRVDYKDKINATLTKASELKLPDIKLIDNDIIEALANVDASQPLAAAQEQSQEQVGW